MRIGVALLTAAVLGAPAAVADGARLDWPLRPPPVVVRAFDAPAPNWQRGHRGVDLAGAPGQPVHAAGAGTVVFAGYGSGLANDDGVRPTRAWQRTRDGFFVKVSYLFRL